MRLLLSVYTLIGALSSGAEGSSPAHALRGVAPHLRAEYAHDGPMFRCRDGSATIPKRMVNDNYCDCADGSDEPGTSACPNGSFFCANKGHISKTIPSMFVDDGNCDCCDGSDEPKGACANTCFELGRHTREELFRAAEAELKGAAIRAERVKEYESLKIKWNIEIRGIDSRLPAAQEALESARAVKEQREREDEERRKEFEAANGPAVAAPVPEPQPAGDDLPEPTEFDDSAFEGFESDHVDPDHHPDFDHDYTDHFEEPHDAPAPVPAEEDPEEIGRRIASRWTNDPAAAGAHAEEPTKEEPQASEEQAQAAEGEGEGGEKKGLFGRFKKMFNRRKAAEGGEEAAPATPAAPTAVYQALPELQQARDAFHAAEKVVNDLSNKKRALEEKLNRSYGADGALAPLAERCFSKNQDKYTYEVCMFGAATQKEGGHSYGTSLGNFKSFEGDAMVFEGGQGCWQGPNRSFRLKLVCGAQEELYKVEEPSRCEYTGEMTTPSVCSAARGQELKAQWTALAKEAEEAANNAKEL